MVLYAQTPGRRNAQVLADVLVLGWVVAWVLLGTAVRETTMALAAPGDRVAAGADRVAASLDEAGDVAQDVPFVGDDLASPFAAAGEAAGTIAAAGRDQAQAVADLATLLGLTVTLVPVLMALAVWLPARLRFARRSAAARRLVRDGADLRLFALRALTHQPVHRLVRVTPDPHHGWHTGDPAVVRALAALELRDAGVLLPAHPSPPGLSDGRG